MTEAELVANIQELRNQAANTYAFAEAGVLSFLMPMETVTVKGQPISKKVTHDFKFTGSACVWVTETIGERTVSENVVEIRGEKRVKARVVTGILLHDVLDILGIIV